MAKGLLDTLNTNVVKSLLPLDPLKGTPLMDSGIIVPDSRLLPLASGISRTFEVPYIHPLDADLEPNYGNTILTDIAVPNVLEYSTMQGRMAYLNNSWLESQLASVITGVNELAYVAERVGGYWRGVTENRVYATLAGIRNFDQANGKKLTVDISKTSADAASKFNGAAFNAVDAMFPENRQRTGAMVIHPELLVEIQNQDALVGKVRPSENDVITHYKGRRLIVTKIGTKIGTGANAKYITTLVADNAVSYASLVGNDDLAIEKTQATGNGAGHKLLWTRRNMLLHPQGFSFVAKESELTGGTGVEALSANWADLEKAANWEIAVSEDYVPFRFLITNI